MLFLGEFEKNIHTGIKFFDFYFTFLLLNYYMYRKSQANMPFLGEWERILMLEFNFWIVFIKFIVLIGCCRKIGHPNWSGYNTDVDVNHNTDHVVLFDETLAPADMEH